MVALGIYKEYYEALFFNHTDLRQNLLFFALFNPVILQYFTILQDKLHSFNIHIEAWASFAQQIIALTTFRPEFYNAGTFLLDRKTPEDIYAGCVGVRKNYQYVEWQWEVE